MKGGARLRGDGGGRHSVHPDSFASPLARARVSLLYIQSHGLFVRLRRPPTSTLTTSALESGARSRSPAEPQLVNKPTARPPKLGFLRFYPCTVPERSGKTWATAVPSKHHECPAGRTENAFAAPHRLKLVRHPARKRRTTDTQHSLLAGAQKVLAEWEDVCPAEPALRRFGCVSISRMRDQLS